MNVDEILSNLQSNFGNLGKEALIEAVAHREEITPALLDVLRDVAANPEPYAADSESMILFYSIYLLAQFRENRAYPLLVQIFSLPGEMPYDLVGDGAMDGLGKILPSVSGGDPSGMFELIENERANAFVRWAALDGLLALVASGQRSRDEVVAYIRGLFQKLDRVPNEVWAGVAFACLDLWPGEMMDELRQALDDKLIDDQMIDWEDFVKARENGLDFCMSRLGSKHCLITDVVEELSGWDLLDDDSGDVFPDDADFDDDEFPGDANLRIPNLEFPVRDARAHWAFDDTPVTIRRTGPKIGRNDPCPCGSGKKYKKCCGG